MRNPLFRKTLLRAPWATALLAATACGGSSDGSSPVATPSQVATTITVSPSVDSLDVGGTKQLVATVLDQNGKPMSIGSINWTRTDAHVVDVSGSGLVSGLLAGNVIVQASLGNLSGSAKLRVRVPAAARYAMDTIGNILNAASIGQIPGEAMGTADASAVELPDKRIRVYFAYATSTNSPGSIGSATSTDGIHFTVDPGARVAPAPGGLEGYGSPMIYALPGGGYRLYYNGCHPAQCGGISSSSSADGLTFTPDSGKGIPPFTKIDQPACAGIVPIAGNRFRIYCSQLVLGLGVTQKPGVSAVFSATSPDLLNWTVDPGVRIGQGATNLVYDARHPTAIVNPDGSISLIYYQHRDEILGLGAREMIANSRDGLTFDTEVDLGVAGTEPSVAKRADGSLWIYYGQQTAATGSTIGVGKLTPIVR